MKTLLALILLLPSLSWGWSHSTWKESSLNLTQILQMEEVEIVDISRAQNETGYTVWRYHLRDVKQFYICNVYFRNNNPDKSYCWYEDW